MINKKNNISKETEQKILEAIKKVGYVPNTVARNLKSQHTNTIGVVVPDISEPFFAQIIKSINAVAEERDYLITLCDSHEDPRRERRLVSLLNENRVEGIIVASVQNDRDIDKMLEQIGCPVVFIDNVPDNARADAVSTDNIAASTLAVESLVKNGHTGLVAIMGKKSEHTGYARYRGYLDALKAHGLPTDEERLRFGDYKEASGYAAMQEFLQSGLSFSAVYVTSSKMTQGALKAIHEKGLRVPEDLSVIGFDIQDKFYFSSSGITTVLQDNAGIGSRAAEIVLERIENPSSAKGNRVVLSPYVETRGSCRSLKEEVDAAGK